MTSLKFTGEVSLEEIYAQNKSIIYDSLFKSIKKSYKNKSVQEIEVIKISINDIEYSIKLNREKFISSLESIISFYEETEEYENCQTCLNMIDELKKNDNLPV